jgi:hypothetical protein
MSLFLTSCTGKAFGSEPNGSAAPAPAHSPATAPVTAARSEQGLRDLLAKYDAATNPQDRAALELQVDKMAGQRYATVSRLFWYTDLGVAKATARANGKAILSLRMLGNLDEDLSCANSRFFRVVLYADPTVRAFLRDNFVLHWSSERPVPVMTIDMGDGRKIVRTTTGNSAHYVLDADGRPIDAIPGLYAPREFFNALQAAKKLEISVRGKADADRERQIAAFHQDAFRSNKTKWTKHSFAREPIGGMGGLSTESTIAAHLTAAQTVTVSKAMVEVPALHSVAFGPDPLKIKTNANDWRLIGQALFEYGTLLAPQITGTEKVLSGPSAALFARLRRGWYQGPTPSIDLDAIALNIFTGNVVGDTAQNEFVLHQQIHQLFSSRPELSRSFSDLNQLIYRNVFFTAPEDEWMGLVDGTIFTALPTEGITRPSATK